MEDNEILAAKLEITGAAFKAGMEVNSGKPVLVTDYAEHFIVPEGFTIKDVISPAFKPKRKTGDRKFTSAESFNSYVNKHKDEDCTIIIADSGYPAVQAVFNDNSKKSPAWADFTAQLDLEFSRQWGKWVDASTDRSGNQKYFSQEDFAAFIVDNRPDFMTGQKVKIDSEEITSISAPELKKLVLNLNVSFNEELKSKLDPLTNEVEVYYSHKEDGDKKFRLPQALVLAIPVYKNGTSFKVVVRLKTKIESQKARYGFIIDQVDATIESAFNKVCKTVSEGQEEETELKDGEKVVTIKAFEGTGVEVYKGPL